MQSPISQVQHTTDPSRGPERLHSFSQTLQPHTLINLRRLYTFNPSRLLKRLHSFSQTQDDLWLILCSTVLFEEKSLLRPIKIALYSLFCEESNQFLSLCCVWSDEVKRTEKQQRVLFARKAIFFSLGFDRPLTLISLRRLLVCYRT